MPRLRDLTRRIAWSLAVAVIAAPAIAHADPITAAAVTFLTNIGVSAAFATFVVNTAISVGTSASRSRIFGKAKGE